MGCSVLNSFYQLDISLLEICFIYILKVGIGGLLSMSAHNPRLQLVTGLPNSPKTKEKGVVLVKGSWYETSSSSSLPFDLNQSLSFLGLSQLDGALFFFFFFEISHILTWPCSLDFTGKRRRGQLVSWVEMASLERIRRLLEIIEAERNHELLLSLKNLRELGASPFHYIVSVIPCPLLEELVKGEHFVLADLFKSILGSSSQAGSTQVEVVEGALVKFFRLDQLPLAKQDP